MGIQAFEGGKWYDAKILKRVDQEMEAYEIHYKNWNKRYDCVKYIKELREPEILITDPIPSPKAKSQIEEKLAPRKLKVGQPAKKGTHVKQPTRGRKIQDPTVSTSGSNSIAKGKIDQELKLIKIEAEAPGKIETQMLRQIKNQLKAAGAKFEHEPIREQYRTQLAVFSASFAQRHVQRLLTPKRKAASESGGELKKSKEEIDDDDVVDWEDLMS